MARALRGTDPKAAVVSKPKILIFGKPGVGKTWTALDFPSVYYLDTEGGANLSRYTDRLKASGGSYLGPDQGANDFDVVLEEIQTLATTKHRYRTLVIDSFSKLFESKIAMTAEAMERAGKKNEFGADKKPAVAMTRRMISWFDKLAMNVILICHEKPLWKDGEQIGVTFAGHEKLEYELHLALNIVKQGPSRKAKVTKSRLEGFPDAESFDWSYEEFARRYGRDVMESEAAPVQMATAEQVKRYEELLAAVKIKPDVLEKWSENGGPEELAAEDLQKRIDFLVKQIPKAGAA